MAAPGVRRAVIAIEDPNPLVNGRGLRYLRERGVDVTVGVMRDEAARQNQPFFTRIGQRRPLVILKAALSLEGALRPARDAYTTHGSGGRSLHPSAARRSRRHRHRVGNLLVDDPLLTPRGAYRGRPLDPRDLRPTTADAAHRARALDGSTVGPVIIVTTQDACASSPDRVTALRRGALESSRRAGAFGSAVRVLADIGIASVVIEGGARLHRARSSRVTWTWCTCTLRRDGLGRVLAWLDAGYFTSAQLEDRSARWLGEDVLVEGHVHGSH